MIVLGNVFELNGIPKARDNFFFLFRPPINSGIRESLKVRSITEEKEGIQQNWETILNERKKGSFHS